jgi:hypothetical protein
MLRRREVLAIAPAACLASGLLSVAKAADEPSVLSVELALPARMGKQRLLEFRGPESHFHVVIRNVTDRPLRLWREWCSWGYFNLSLAVELPGGKSVEVKKKARGWDKNYPDWEEIGPREVAVREIHYGGPEWENFPLEKAQDGLELKLQAVFAVDSDKDASTHGVWTGRAASRALTVAFYNYT